MARRTLLVLVLALALAAVGCGDDDGGDTEVAGSSEVTEAPAEAGGTYAIVLPSSRNDGSFSQVGYAGLTAGVDAVGGESLFLENVQVADAEEAFRNLASQDADVVIGLGGQFADSGAAVAAEFPDTHFVVVNGTQTGENLSYWSLAEGEIAYLGGVMVATILEPDKIGRIAGLEIPPLKFGTAGFIDGARSVNPDTEYFSAFTGDFDDVAAAREQTLAAFEDGAKVVLTGMNNAITGQEQAAAEAGGLLMNNNIDKCDDPETGDVYFGAITSDTTFAVQTVVEGIASGDLTPGFTRSTLEEDEGYQVAYCEGEVPAEALDAVNAAREALLSGEVSVGLEPAEG